jgi:hypothetical protein
MIFAAEKTFTVEEIGTPDTRLAREIAEFLSDTDLRYCSTTRAAFNTGVRLPESVVVSSSIAGDVSRHGFELCAQQCPRFEVRGPNESPLHRSLY